MNKAFIFPGQGAQKLNMVKDFYDNFAVAREVFEEVNEALARDITKVVFGVSEQELALTINAQPALMASSMVILRVLQAQTGQKISKMAEFAAGHSLGEYTALCAAGALSLTDAAKLLEIRAAAMQHASPPGEGAMAACIGISFNELNAILQNAITEGVCQIANDNVAGQLVISGHEYNINMISSILKDGGFKVIKLQVSGPFHSELVRPAIDVMKKAFALTTIKKTKMKVVANISVELMETPKMIEKNLLDQICGMVRWRETIDYFADQQVNELVEIGPGSTLNNLAKRSGHDFKLINISNIAEMDDYLNNL